MLVVCAESDNSDTFVASSGMHLKHEELGIVSSRTGLPMHAPLVRENHRNGFKSLTNENAFHILNTDPSVHILHLEYESVLVRS